MSNQNDTAVHPADRDGYTDHANDPGLHPHNNEESVLNMKVAMTFPLKLYRALQLVDRDGHGHIINWQPHGRSFVHSRSRSVRVSSPATPFWPHQESLVQTSTTRVWLQAAL